MFEAEKKLVDQITLPGVPQVNGGWVVAGLLVAASLFLWVATGKRFR